MEKRMDQNVGVTEVLLASIASHMHSPGLRVFPYGTILAGMHWRGRSIFAMD